MTSYVLFSSEPVAGMTPSVGTCTSDGVGKPAAIVPARWNWFVELSTFVCFTG